MFNTRLAAWIASALAIPAFFSSPSLGQDKPKHIVILVHGERQVRQPPSEVDKVYAPILGARLANTLVLPFCWSEVNAVGGDGMFRNTVGGKPGTGGGMGDSAWAAAGKLKNIIGRCVATYPNAELTVVSEKEGCLVTLVALNDGFPINNWILLNASIDSRACFRSGHTDFAAATKYVESKIINIWKSSIAHPNSTFGSSGFPETAPQSPEGAGGWGMALIPYQKEKYEAAKSRVTNVRLSSSEWWSEAVSQLTSLAIVEGAQIEDDALRKETRSGLGNWSVGAQAEFDSDIFLPAKGSFVEIIRRSMKSARAYGVECVSGSAELEITSLENGQSGTSKKKLRKGTEVELVFDSTLNSDDSGTVMAIKATALSKNTKFRLSLNSSSTGKFASDISVWKNVLNFRPPVEVEDSVNDQGKYWEIQRLEDATRSSSVALDAYTVHITKMPDGFRDADGPQKFLNVVRAKLTEPPGSDPAKQLINSKITQFYVSDGEKELWENDDYNSAIVHMKMGFGFGPAIEQATVVASKMSNRELIFSTVRSGNWFSALANSEKNAGHPVSGNRAFGIMETKRKGVYTFYTVAADRRTTILDEGAARLGITQPLQDKLWKSLQDGIIRFVADNGGTAERGVSMYRSLDWDVVLRSGVYKVPLLSGKTSFDIDKLKLGDIFVTKARLPLSNSIAPSNRKEVFSTGVFVGAKPGGTGNYVVDVIGGKKRAILVDELLKESSRATLFRHQALTEKSRASLRSYLLSDTVETVDAFASVEEFFCAAKTANKGSLFDIYYGTSSASDELLTSDKAQQIVCGWNPGDGDWYVSKLVVDAFRAAQVSIEKQTINWNESTARLSGALEFIGEIETPEASRKPLLKGTEAYEPIELLRYLKKFSQGGNNCNDGRAENESGEFDQTRGDESTHFIAHALKAANVTVAQAHECNAGCVYHHADLADAFADAARTMPKVQQLRSVFESRAGDFLIRRNRRSRGNNAFVLAGVPTRFGARVFSHNKHHQGQFAKFDPSGFNAYRIEVSDIKKPVFTALHEIKVPLPSSKIERCAEFYSTPEISRFLREAFMGNAIHACEVTGTSISANRIRKHLQELYRTEMPDNGDYFTAAEHKAIHDKAYKAAGCSEEESANILGWYAVDLPVDFAWPSFAVKNSIDWFGECTLKPSRRGIPLKKGIYVGGRDLNGVPIGTHQFIVLVPFDQNKITDSLQGITGNPTLRDLGDGTLAIVVGAHNVDDRLQVKWFEDADLTATKEYVMPLDRHSVKFDAEFHQVDIGNDDLDASILRVIDIVKNYIANELANPFPYKLPTSPKVINSNSWAQSVIDRSIRKNSVVEHMRFRADLGAQNRIRAMYFVKP